MWNRYGLLMVKSGLVIGLRVWVGIWVSFDLIMGLCVAPGGHCLTGAYYRAVDLIRSHRACVRPERINKQLQHQQQNLNKIELYPMVKNIYILTKHI